MSIGLVYSTVWFTLRFGLLYGLVYSTFFFMIRFGSVVFIILLNQ